MIKLNSGFEQDKLMSLKEEMPPGAKVAVFLKDQSSTLEGEVVFVGAEGVFIRKKNESTVFINWKEILKIRVEEESKIKILHVVFALIVFGLWYFFSTMAAYSGISSS